jgi:hypothetical protein
MNDDIRSTLATAVGTPPPLGFTSAGLIDGARRRRARRRVTGAAVAVLAVAGGVLAAPLALQSPGPAGSVMTASGAHPPGSTQRELAARMDRAVRAAAPARLTLIRREVRWLEREVDATGTAAALWRAQYWVGAAEGPRLNVATNERPPAGQQLSCALAGQDALSCRESTAPDGTKLVILTVSAGGDRADPLLLHGVQNIRRDGTEAAAYVMFLRSQRIPLTDAQLIRVATDPAIHYLRPSDAGPPPSGR